MPVMNEQRAVYTIGHSNHPPDKLLGLLVGAGIEVLVDIRSNPGSRWAPHTRPATLRALLDKAAIRYLHLGDALGGRPKDPDCYDPSTHKPDYRVIERTPFFRAGLARLEADLERSRVCIMCSEEDPTACHRSRLVGLALRERGIRVLHIRKDGLLQPDELLDSSPPAGAHVRPRQRAAEAQLPLEV